MKYLFITPGMSVANWRTRWPALELARRGYDVAYHHTNAPIPADLAGDVTFILHVVNQGWYDDKGHLLTCLDLAFAAAMRGRLWLQFDDDWTSILEIEPRPWREAPLRILDQLPTLVGMADRVIVATPRLRAVYSQWCPDVRVAMNYLPEEVLAYPQPPRRPVLAWMGTMDVHGRDWMQLEPHARRLPPLRLVGAGEAAARVLRHWGAPHVEATPPTLDQPTLYGMVGEAQAAIVPLRPSPFNAGKSWIKPMEFMARGVPVVAQAHSEYVRLAALTGGAVTVEADPGALVDAACAAFDAGGGDELPDRLRGAGLTMEQKGGDAWERALAA